ncbi:hypothetical protein IFM89_024720 [Coptis chinensis]|uniref:Uncharacterized protein n=1 Tax=Coptis chinensis TaxID=261450 RepID=A0A835H5Q0_9MAGN|nr:hypothetical protein IFM89_024720 [Coptis chinensis]
MEMGSVELLYSIGHQTGTETLLMAGTPGPNMKLPGADTGNQIHEPAGPRSPCAHNPYGQNLIGESTGRCSNGLLMIDFLNWVATVGSVRAQALGLPTNPYLELGVSFNHGVNFAVAGSTALNTSVLLDNRILSPVTNSSLLVQLDWFLAHYRTSVRQIKIAITYSKGLSSWWAKPEVMITTMPFYKVKASRMPLL